MAITARPAIRKPLTIFGLVLTVGLVVGAVVFFLKSNTAMTLNEWGDFLAGVSAPLALLWLVIGYFQHGQELQLNTAALRTQQEELHLQVEATKRLAEAAQQDLAYRQQREAQEAEPYFVFSLVGSMSPGSVEINIENRGGEVHDVSHQYNGLYQSILHLPTPYIERYGTARLEFTFARELEWPIRFRINSTDRLGKTHSQECEFSPAGASRIR